MSLDSRISLARSASNVSEKLPISINSDCDIMFYFRVYCVSVISLFHKLRSGQGMCCHSLKCAPFYLGLLYCQINKQSVKIDVVSGATVNTKAFQKAVENALAE